MAKGRGVNTSFFMANLYGCKVRRDEHGEIYAVTRKKYTRTHPYPILHMIGDKCFKIIHTHSLPREKTAIIKLRNFGHNIHNIAQGLGRSASYIWAILKKARDLKTIRKFDNRKIPRTAKQLMSRSRLSLCLFWIQKWQDFILGVEEEPP